MIKFKKVIVILMCMVILTANSKIANILDNNSNDLIQTESTDPDGEDEYINN
ncbi:hypothetical protein JYG23_11705 [Sedimentibacter sp. zth1]|uniref:hypothetical protein n=1 Tax=Sedimentibacter sp. zth1 TaxID=2816908 RepID=UPI001A937C9F|nr:hypothetical protein [Sedimentibacter sp. zth1]QSX05335.1 hypothetical protein JYG23_11705 [Sedimentibacter sp. zth1]